MRLRRVHCLCGQDYMFVATWAMLMQLVVARTVLLLLFIHPLSRSCACRGPFVFLCSAS